MFNYIVVVIVIIWWFKGYTWMMSSSEWIIIKSLGCVLGREFLFFVCSVWYGPSFVHATINYNVLVYSLSVKVVYFWLFVALRNDDKELAAHQSWARYGGSYPGWLWYQNTTTSAGTVGPPSSGTRASSLPPRENISMRKGREGSICRGRINLGVRIGA